MKMANVLELVRQAIQDNNPSNAHCLYHLAQVVGSAPDVEIVIPIEAQVEVSTVVATGAAVLLALEHDVNLTDVYGTGAAGQVTKSDIEATLKD